MGMLPQFLIYLSFYLFIYLFYILQAQKVNIEQQFICKICSVHENWAFITFSLSKIINYYLSSINGMPQDSLPVGFPTITIPNCGGQAHLQVENGPGPFTLNDSVDWVELLLS